MAFRYPNPSEEPMVAGEGITMTADPAAKLWPAVVTFAAGDRMRCTIRAINAQQAEQFALARHPLARTVTIEGDSHD
jgi:hypothetical protein